jgi:hypothetical protein
MLASTVQFSNNDQPPAPRTPTGALHGAGDPRRNSNRRSLRTQQRARHHPGDPTTVPHPPGGSTRRSGLRNGAE